ncbi:hypothetical protein C6P42_004580, partial [Pichia californica]
SSSASSSLSLSPSSMMTTPRQNSSTRSSSYNNTPILDSKFPKLFINFCSGSSVFQKQYWPSNVEKTIRNYSLDDFYTKHCGIVVFDYAERNDWKL